MYHRGWLVSNGCFECLVLIWAAIVNNLSALDHGGVWLDLLDTLQRLMATIFNPLSRYVCSCASFDSVSFHLGFGC
jgi:hypothetical protein